MLSTEAEGAGPLRGEPGRWRGHRGPQGERLGAGGRDTVMSGPREPNTYLLHRRGHLTMKA